MDVGDADRAHIPGGERLGEWIQPAFQPFRAVQLNRESFRTQIRNCMPVVRFEGGWPVLHPPAYPIGFLVAFVVAAPEAVVGLPFAVATFTT